MAKTALGRGLGHLMNGGKPANSSEQTALPLDESGAAQSAPVGPGLSKLLKGQRPAEASPAPATTVTAPQATPTHTAPGLRWALAAADVLLVILAFWLVLGRGKAPGFWELFLGSAAICVGACLGCWAYLLGAKK